MDEDLAHIVFRLGKAENIHFDNLLYSRQYMVIVTWVGVLSDAPCSGLRQHNVSRHNMEGWFWRLQWGQQPGMAEVFAHAACKYCEELTASRL